MRILAVALAFGCWLLSMSATASASSSVVGTYTVADQGQGGWSGGPLYADGTVGGGGGISFVVTLPDGTKAHEIGTVSGGTWTEPSSGAPVTLSLNITPIQDPLRLFAAPFVTPPIPPNGTPIVIDGTLFRVNLQGR